MQGNPGLVLAGIARLGGGVHPFHRSALSSRWRVGFQDHRAQGAGVEHARLIRVAGLANGAKGAAHGRDGHLGRLPIQKVGVGLARAAEREEPRGPGVADKANGGVLAFEILLGGRAGPLDLSFAGGKTPQHLDVEAGQPAGGFGPRV